MDWIYKIAPFVLTVVVNFLINSGYNKRRFEEIERKQQEIDELDISVVFEKLSSAVGGFEGRLEKFEKLDVAVVLEKLSSTVENLEGQIAKYEGLDIAVKLQKIESRLDTFDEKFSDMKRSEEKRKETHKTYMEILNQLQYGQGLIMENFKLTPKQQ